MTTQTTIRVAAPREPDWNKKSLHLVEFADDFRGTHYAIFHGVGTRGRWFEGRNAFAKASRAFDAKASALGFVTIRNAAGPLAQAA